MSITADQIPGYIAGTWKIDPVHSEVGFSVRHLAVSKVKGKFEQFDATIVTAENPLDSTVNATAEVASVNTNQEYRDQHLRSGDFFMAEEHPQLKFVSTGMREEGGNYFIDGDLTMRGTTKPVSFEMEFGGFGHDAEGNSKMGLSAKTVVKREDFGISWNAPLEKGGFVLAQDVTILLEVQADLQQ
ncbi:MAG TPA: YceI family protein [Microbacteriaceae bacterium]|nr:YceI family protein [Microbacteriaceae bacterium]